MAKIRNFEEIQSWQKGRELTNLIYDLTSQNAFSKDFESRNQIRRAAGSVMHNIAEGFESGSNREFTSFLRMSRRSAMNFNPSCIWPWTVGILLRSNAHQRINFVLR